MPSYKNTLMLGLAITLPLLLAACSGGGSSSNGDSISENNGESSEGMPDDSFPDDDHPEENLPDDNTPDIDWLDEPGIPDSAALLPPGTPCEEFSHVDHLPWDERPSACPTGDWCMKKDDGFIPGATTWFGTQAVTQYATITCKIGNKCYRFAGMNNCHYDLYDPDLNTTLMPNDTIPWARKDGHSYLNFRVRLPGSNTIYNFMSTTVEAIEDAKEAVYCPANVYAPDGVEPLLFDPRQSDQTTGCGPDAPHLGLYGDAREAIPYSTEARDAYDWVYRQDGE